MIILDAQVGDFIRFAEEKQKYKIQARNERYLICNKPWNLKRTYAYTIVDLQENIRGASNSIFGSYAGSQQECEVMLAELMDENDWLEISHRNYVKLDIEKVIKAK